jgi:chromosome partitioning protein
MFGYAQSMKVLAFMTQKGGTGKTTLAASVAVAAQEDGERVFLIDLDPQGSLTSWGDRREAETPPVDKVAPAKFPSAIQALANTGYTLAIVDTAGMDSAATAAAMQAATLSLIPARPSALDIEAARPTVSALSRLQRPFAFVINQTPTGRTSRPLDASRALNLLGVLSPVMLAQRADHLDAIALGLGVTEFQPAGKAADEVRQLWAWAKKRMEGKKDGPA